MMSVVKNAGQSTNLTDGFHADFGVFSQFARAYTPLNVAAVFKSSPEDFIVEEQLPFKLSGTGEHSWIHIQKSGCNTEWVARALAQAAGVSQRQVGYAGLKDRHGVTSQWFSVHLPGKKDPDWSRIETEPDDNESLKIIEVNRHNRKLRRGALKRNRFQIRLKPVGRASSGERLDQLEQRCQLISERGVPNYFGEQRFGRALGNLKAAQTLFTDSQKRVQRHEKSLYLSAARSWLFNQVLSHRVHMGSWNRYIPGDVFMLEGKSACFLDDESEDLKDRIDRGEIHPTSMLWGEGDLMTRDDAAALEARIVQDYPVFRDGLIAFRVLQKRRALRVLPGNMSWQLEQDAFQLAFDLPAGAYATMVLRELFDLEEVHT